MKHQFDKNQIALAITAVLSAATLAPAFAGHDTPPAPVGGTYVSGDIHNHTTCSDGSISMQKLIKKATDRSDTDWGLDWFVQAGHGGNGNRNCTLVEDASLATRAYPVVFTFHGCGSPDNYVPMQKTAGNDAILVRGAGITGGCWTYGASGDDVKFFDAMLADIEAKRQSAVAERMAKLPELDAAIRQALVARPHRVEIVPAN